MAPTDGWCLACDGSDQNGKITRIGTGLSETECISKCKGEVDATGCEFHVSGACTVHKAPVSKGSGSGRGYKCWTKGDQCQGKPYADLFDGRGNSEYIISKYSIPFR